MSISTPNRETVACRCLLLLAVAVAMVAGGGCIPRENKWVGITRVSRNGSDMYFKAKAQYDVIRVQDPQGQTLKSEMDAVMIGLDAAIVNDPKCPLFSSKRGEMFLELGPDGYPRAESDLKNAIADTEDWVPAWILLADLESRRGHTDVARKYIAGAEQANESLRKQSDNQPILFSVMGLTIDLMEAQEKRPDDPALEESQRQALLLTWLQENEQWSIDSPALLMPAKGGNGQKTVNSANLFRRLHARIEFQKIVVMLREGADPQVVLPMFGVVFDWDPDYFPARVEKAEQLRRAGLPNDAERLLRPYMDSPNPKVAGNGRLLYEMGAIYTDWYAISPNNAKSEELSKLAEDCFTKLLSVNEQHGMAWAKRAELYAIAGRRSGRADTLADARKWLSNAREVLKGDTPETRHAAQLLDPAYHPPATQPNIKESSR